MSFVGADPAEREQLLELSRRLCTRREQQVVAWSLRGAGTRKIAEMLGLSESTVRTHLRRARDKFDQAAA